MDAKNRRQFAILTLLVALTLSGEWLFFNLGENKEEIALDITYFSPRENSTVTYYEQLHIEIKQSRGTFSETNPAPCIIMLHGDEINKNSFAFVENQFMMAGFMVVLVDTPDNLGMEIVTLNITLNYLLTRPDVDPQRIGALGHSHGAHYVSLFAAIRNDSIRTVIAGNYGPFGMFYSDYYNYYTEFVNYTCSSSSSINVETIPLPFTATNPRNFLMITDTNDYAPDRPPSEYLYNFSSGLYLEPNKQYGSFSDGTARELRVFSSIVGHGASLYDADVIRAEVQWFQASFGMEDNAMPLAQMQTWVVFGFILISLLAFVLFGLVGKILVIIPQQGEYIRRLKQKFTKSPPASSGQTPAENPKPPNHPKLPTDATVHDINSLLPTSYSELPLEEFQRRLKQIFKILLITIIILAVIKGLALILVRAYYMTIYSNQGLSLLFNFALNGVIDVYSILDLIGIYTYFITVFFSNYFPMAYMVVWAGIFIFITRRILNDKEGLSHYTGKEYFKAILIAGEMYILCWLAFHLIWNEWLGYSLYIRELYNALLTCIVLYSINIIVLPFYHSYLLASNKAKGVELNERGVPKAKKENLKMYIKTVSVTCLFTELMLIPSIAFEGFNFNLLLVGGLALISVINPMLYQNGHNLLSLTIFNYLLLLLLY